jgi:site-specific recombinase XerD
MQCEAASGVYHAMRLIKQRYPIELDAIQLEVAAYVDHLRNNRGFQEGTIKHHKRALEAFLRQIIRNEAVHTALGKLSAKEVHDYIEQLPTTSANFKKKKACTALHGYFRFLALKGLNVEHLSGAVPSVACSRPALFPKIISPDDIHILLDSVDISTPMGKRTRAVILALSDLGMRIGDVSRLKLDDIDWRNGTIRVENRKRATPYCLPLPKRLGEALVDYIKNGRLLSKAREIFLSHGHSKPVGKPASASALQNAVDQQWIASGLHGKYSGTHILRHTTATRLKQEGVPLKSIADVLGHSSIDTTALYVQVDVPALRTVTQPWPEGRS